MPELRRKTCVSYVELSVQLNGCVTDVDVFADELRQWLKTKLTPDFDDDIVVEIGLTTQH